MRDDGITRKIKTLKSRVDELKRCIGQSVSQREEPLSDVFDELNAALDELWTAQEELRESGERFRALIETAGCAIVFLSPDCRILEFNREAERIYGWQRQEVLGKEYFDLFLPERARDNAAADIKKVLAGEPIRGFEHSARAQDGSERILLWNATCLCGNDGTRIGIIATGQDITKRKQAEKALQESEARFRRLAESNMIAIAFWDVDGKLTDANDAFLRLIGYTREEVVSKKVGWRDITPPEYSYLDDRAIEEMKMSKVCTPFEKEYVRKDGRRVPILLGGALLEGSQHEGVAFAVDLTERKRMEESLRGGEQRLRNLVQVQERQLIVSDRLVSLGELMASIAHEFNNPLGIVMGFAQDLLTEVEPSSPLYQPLKIIGDEAGRCKKLMQDLLDFARPTESDLRLMDLSEVVWKSADLVSAQLRKLGVKTKIEVQPGLPHVKIDPQQLKQVLLNLYFNSMEAMPGGGVLGVRVLVKPLCSGNPIGGDLSEASEVVIAVTDTGHGIDPQDMSNIFRPFFSTKKSKGMGLGLSICEKIIKGHGGRIDVESTPGRGTTFKLYFPVGTEGK